MSRRGKPEAITGEVNDRMVEGIDTTFDTIFSEIANSLETPSSMADGDIVYWDDGVLKRLAINTTATRYLGVTSSLPAWQQINLANGVTGVLPVVNGGSSGGSVGDWTTTVTKATDEDVTNSITLQNDDELLLVVTANSLWYLQLLIAYSGTTAAEDFLWNISISAGTMTGTIHSKGLSATNAIQALDEAIVAATAAPFDRSWGTEASQGMRIGYIDIFLKFTSAATFNFQFAQRVAGVATVARCEAGSLLRAKQLIV